MRHLAFGAIFAFSTAVSQATVLPVDLDSDGQFNAFLDETSGLLWTNANVATPKIFSAAQSAIAEFDFEGVTTWRMPTVNEYALLYQTQGGDGSGINESPFSVPYNNYWSTDVFPEIPGQYLTFAVHAQGGFVTVPHFPGTQVGVWAVSSIPELPSATLLLAGALLVLAAGGRRRRGDA